jgi:hypothetical protein
VAVTVERAQLNSTKIKNVKKMKKKIIGKIEWQPQSFLKTGYYNSWKMLLKFPETLWPLVAFRC